MNTQSETQPYIKQMPKGECTYCDLEYDKPTGLFPPHTASPRCQSGHHNHCTCDTCFQDFMKKYILIPTICLLLASCSLGEPWSQKRIEGIRQAFCVEEMGEDPYSKSCDCFVAATQNNFKNFTAFARSNGPTQQYRDDLLWCGYVLGP